MSEVRRDYNEPIESALRRFNKKVQQDGVLAEYRRRSYYEKPTTRRKRKRATKLRKSIRSSMGKRPGV